MLFSSSGSSLAPGLCGRTFALVPVRARFLCVCFVCLRPTCPLGGLFVVVAQLTESGSVCEITRAAGVTSGLDAAVVVMSLRRDAARVADGDLGGRMPAQNPF
jgi:hypothetical protein